MREKWILEVLADMRVFARSNGLGDLASALEYTADVANRELATRNKTGDLSGDIHVIADPVSPFELR